MRYWATLISGITITIALASSGVALGKPPKATKLPEDLNEESLRVTALDTLYSLDLSADQLALLRSEAAQTAGAEPAASAGGFPKLAAALRDLHDALLQGKDDQKIATLRNQVVDLVSANGDKLNDDVTPTDAAREMAGTVSRQLKASQIAAYLALHADEISDPAERMVGAAMSLSQADAADQASEIQAASNDVGRLVAGLDDAKASAVAAQVTQWLEANKSQTDDSDAGQRALEASAKGVIGEVPPMDVLNHWLEIDMVSLLSNPQLVGAIDEMSAAQQQQPQ